MIFMLFIQMIRWDTSFSTGKLSFMCIYVYLAVSVIAVGGDVTYLYIYVMNAQNSYSDGWSDPCLSELVSTQFSWIGLKLIFFILL